MKRIVLLINDFYTTQEAMEMVCHGLGSCVGLFLQDRYLNITSGAHIPVTISYEHTGYKSAEEILMNMFNQLSEKGSSLKNLRAKIVGGASIFKSSYKIGEENVNVIRELLINKKVFIAAQDTGGNIARTAYFNSATGDCRVQKAAQQIYII